MTQNLSLCPGDLIQTPPATPGGIPIEPSLFLVLEVRGDIVILQSLDYGWTELAHAHTLEHDGFEITSRPAERTRVMDT